MGVLDPTSKAGGEVASMGLTSQAGRWATGVQPFYGLYQNQKKAKKAQEEAQAAAEAAQLAAEKDAATAAGQSALERKRRARMSSTLLAEDSATATTGKTLLGE